MTDSKYEVLLSAAEGEEVKDTAARTGCHKSWVCRLRHEICDELGARNMTHAVALAYQKGLLRSK